MKQMGFSRMRVQSKYAFKPIGEHCESSNGEFTFSYMGVYKYTCVCVRVRACCVKICLSMLANSSSMFEAPISSVKEITCNKLRQSRNYCHYSVRKYLSFPVLSSCGCYAVPTGKQSSTFRRKVRRHFQGPVIQ